MSKIAALLSVLARGLEDPLDFSLAVEEGLATIYFFDSFFFGDLFYDSSS